jgi:hypothetical protein
MPGDPVIGAGGSSSAGSEGNRVAYITLPPMPKAAAPRAVPVPVPPAKRVEVPPRELPEEPTAVVAQPVDTIDPLVTVRTVPNGATSAGSDGSGSGDGNGQSLGNDGPGGGAGSGTGGEGGRARPPEPRDMAFPFDTPPKELRGASLSVTFWVRMDGQVERYTVVPAIKDRDYAKKFDEVMRAFRFTPARASSGQAVAGTTTITITLPGKHTS